MTNTCLKLFPNKKFLIGMIHLPLLPGYPGYLGKNYIIKKALEDLKTLESAGFDGILVENHEGIPGFVRASLEIKEIIKQVVKKVKDYSKLPVGMEIIYDMPATVDIAIATRCDFVRLDVFADSVETRWGTVPNSHKEINRIMGSSVYKPLLFVDVHVKHARLLAKISLEKSIITSLDHGADGIIVTGTITGVEPKREDLSQAKKIVTGKVPVLIGSGLTVSNASKLLSLADGAIVGTSIKTGSYIDFKKAHKLVSVVRNLS